MDFFTIETFIALGESMTDVGLVLVSTIYCLLLHYYNRAKIHH